MEVGARAKLTIDLNVAENNYPIGHPHPTLPPLETVS